MRMLGSMNEEQGQVRKRDSREIDWIGTVLQGREEDCLMQSEKKEGLTTR